MLLSGLLCSHLLLLHLLLLLLEEMLLFIFSALLEAQDLLIVDLICRGFEETCVRSVASARVSLRSWVVHRAIAFFLMDSASDLAQNVRE